MGSGLVMFSAYFIPYLYSSLPPANEVCEGYVFTPVCQSFCSGRGGVSLSACWDTPHLGSHPPRSDTPLGRHPPGSRHPPAQCMLGNTSNKREVRILLECILVPFYLLRNHINIVISQWQIQDFPEDGGAPFPEEGRAWTHYLAKGLLKTAWIWKKLDPLGSANLIIMKWE